MASSSSSSAHLEVSLLCKRSHHDTFCLDTVDSDNDQSKRQCAQFSRELPRDTIGTADASPCAQRLPSDIIPLLAEAGGPQLAVALAQTCRRYKAVLDERYQVHSFWPLLVFLEPHHNGSEAKRRSGVVGKFRSADLLELSDLARLPSTVHNVRFMIRDRMHLYSYPMLLPRFLKSITFFLSFSEPLDYFTFPDTLEELLFLFHFNDRQSVGGLRLPVNLRRLTLSFSQPVTQLHLPSELQHLTFGILFNEPVDQLHLPPQLQSLTFGSRFNQPVARLRLPAGLRALSFGSAFRHSLDELQLPNSLQSVTFGGYFTHFLHPSGRLVVDKTPLMIAIRGDRFEIMRWLVVQGHANVNEASKAHETALTIAASCGCITSIIFLIEHKADVDYAPGGFSPLWIAAERQDLLVVQCLVELGKADVNHLSGDGCSPLFVAAQKGYLEMVQWLVTFGRADANLPDIDGRTPLWIAIARGRLQVAIWLVEKGHADVSCISLDGPTLMRATLHMRDSKMMREEFEIRRLANGDFYQAMHFLCKYGANVNEAGILSIAEGKGDLETVEWLVEDLNANVNYVDATGLFPLWAAASRSHWVVVQWLLKHRKIDVSPANIQSAPLPMQCLLVMLRSCVE